MLENCERLLSREGYACTTLAEPSQFRQVAAALQPDVIVTDLRMPGMDGMEVLRHVRKAYPGVEVIIMTGHGSEQDEEEARRLGVFDYLRKPVDINRLVTAIRNAGRAARGGP